MAQSGYIASCVRARAMKGILLAPDEWQQLALMDSAEDVMGFLHQRGLISATTIVETAEKELRERNIATAASLIRFVHGAAFEALKYFVYYYDLLNVETLISHLHTGGASGEMLPLLYDTGRLGMVDVENLASVTSYPVLTNCLRGSVLYDVFKRELESYERDEDVAGFVAAIELDFMRGWQRVVQRCRRGAVGASQSLFDAFLKVKAADGMLRLRFRRESGEHLVASWNELVPGGLVGSDMSGWYNIEDERDSFKYLLGRLGGGGSIHETEADGADAQMDKGMMRTLLDETLRIQRRGGFTVDYIMSFLFRVMLQSEDLVSLLECKDFGLANDEVASYLVGDV